MAKRTLSRASIVAAAIRIADEKGIAAVSLRGIASRLGVHVTSLYNHVPTKDAVLEEMVKTLVAEAKLPAGTVTWQRWVRAFADGMRAVAGTHPGAFEAFHQAPVQGPRAAEAFEAAFAAFRSAGFDDAATYCAVKATSVAVIGLAVEDTARARRPGMRTDLSELPIEMFPMIHRVASIAESADTFSYLIDTLISGFEASLAAAR